MCYCWVLRGEIHAFLLMFPYFVFCSNGRKGLGKILREPKIDLFLYDLKNNAISLFDKSGLCDLDDHKNNIGSVSFTSDLDPTTGAYKCSVKISSKATQIIDVDINEDIIGNINLREKSTLPISIIILF